MPIAIETLPLDEFLNVVFPSLVGQGLNYDDYTDVDDFVIDNQEYGLEKWVNKGGLGFSFYQKFDGRNKTLLELNAGHKENLVHFSEHPFVDGKELFAEKGAEVFYILKKWLAEENVNLSDLETIKA